MRKHRYASRDSFEADINQIVDNSILYNGEMSPLTMVAKNMLLMAQKKMQEVKKKLEANSLMFFIPFVPYNTNKLGYSVKAGLKTLDFSFQANV